MFSFFNFKEFPFQKLKAAIHSLQAFILSLAFILCIVIMAKPGGATSAIYFYFLLTWISIPALLYSGLLPFWQRFARFHNPYATAAIDLLYFIFWIGAFAAVYVWANNSITDAAKGCESFSYGDKDKCQTTYVTAVMGMMLTILWLMAAGISIYCLLHYRKHGYLPNSRPSISEPKPNMTEPKVGGFFSRAPKTENAPPPPQTRLYRERLDIEHGSVHTETEDGLHPGRKLSWGQSPPLTAPSRFELGVRPQFRPVSYGDPKPLHENLAASSRNPATRNATPPRLQLWGTDNGRAPSLVFDYTGIPITPKGPLDTRRGVLPPFVSPRGVNAVSSATSSYETQPTVLRNPAPGPASQHHGGYNSAYHTPLPTGMIEKGGNSWRDDMMRGYNGQQLDFSKGRYAR